MEKIIPITTFIKVRIAGKKYALDKNTLTDVYDLNLL